MPGNEDEAAALLDDFRGHQSGGGSEAWESPDTDTHGVDADDRPPICSRCGVTMLPAALSADDEHEGDWVCLECEELDERD